MMYFFAGLAQVPVVLLIGPVKLQEIIVVIGEMILGGIVHGGGQRAGQSRAGSLDFFVVCQFNG